MIEKRKNWKVPNKDLWKEVNGVVYWNENYSFNWHTGLPHQTFTPSEPRPTGKYLEQIKQRNTELKEQRRLFEERRQVSGGISNLQKSVFQKKIR